MLVLVWTVLTKSSVQEIMEGLAEMRWFGSLCSKQESQTNSHNTSLEYVMNIGPQAPGALCWSCIEQDRQAICAHLAAWGALIPQAQYPCFPFRDFFSVGFFLQASPSYLLLQQPTPVPLCRKAAPGLLEAPLPVVQRARGPRNLHPLRGSPSPRASQTSTVHRSSTALVISNRTHSEAKKLDR